MCRSLNGHRCTVWAVTGVPLNRGITPYRGSPMCLGIVGQIVSVSEHHPDLARVDVAGTPRDINIVMLAGEGLRRGDWILIHAGFAMEKIDEETARQQMEVLREYTGGPPGLEDDAEEP